MLHSPWALLLLLFLPVLVWLRLSRPRRGAAVKFSSVGRFAGCPVSWRLRFRPLVFTARLVCVALLVVAVARPRKGLRMEQVSTEGVALMMVVDRSGSMDEPMLYQGRKVNRLEVVKEVAADFIEGDDKDYEGRKGDMIGLVTYARYADTQCPLVRGSSIITDFLRDTQVVRLRAEDGTAIGDGIALAAARLKTAETQLTEMQALRAGETTAEGEKNEPEFKIKSKVMILLTDGVNNAGQYHPMEAAKMAAEWGIKIYTIGIGSSGRQRGIFGMTGPDLDERLLKAIAEQTGGFYARADNASQLRDIYKRIDELEKTDVKSVEYVDYAEQFMPWAWGALGALLFEIIAGSTLFRKIP